MAAWLPKMLHYPRRVLFIDGFAGPGEYIDGEDGSPIIALEALTSHSAFDKMQGEIIFVFIEKDQDRAKHLESVVEPYKERLSENCIRIFNSPFSEKISEILDAYESSGQRFPPAFVMIDPFGVAHAPMSVIRRILSYPSTEVSFSFMYEAINRFGARPEFERHLDDLFGCKDWREGLSVPDQDSKRMFFYDLYEECLREAGAESVLRYELYKGEKPVYAIFFASQRLEGCEVMKDAMWKTSPSGSYQFKGAKAHQPLLGIDQIDFVPFRRELRGEFGPRGWVSIEEVQQYVRSDKTFYRTGHLKVKTLRPMETEGELEARSSNPNWRPGIYPPGTQLRFLML